MADRTAQPPAATGVHPDLAASARFLWNGAEPLKNALNNADSTTGLKGTTVTGGPDGQYQRFSGTDGSMSWAVTAPTGAYTLVVGVVFPVASIDVYARLFQLGSSGGFRLEAKTTGGGCWLKATHTAVGAAVNEFAESVAGFDGQAWTYVARFSGAGGTPANTLVQYLLRGDGTVVATVSETLTYVAPSGDVVLLGDTFNTPGQGAIAAFLADGDLGETEALAQRSNLWRMFAPEVTGPVITGPLAGGGRTHSTLTQGRLAP